MIHEGLDGKYSVSSSLCRQIQDDDDVEKSEKNNILKVILNEISV